MSETRPNRSFDTDTQRHCAASRAGSIRLAVPCHCEQDLPYPSAAAPGISYLFPARSAEFANLAGWILNTRRD